MHDASGEKLTVTAKQYPEALALTIKVASATVICLYDDDDDDEAGQ